MAYDIFHFLKAPHVNEASYCNAEGCNNAVKSYLLGLASTFERPESLPSTRGCLFINTANAPIGADEQVSPVISAYRDELRVAFDSGIQAARGDLSIQRQDLLAESITGQMIAACALVRMTATEAVLLLACMQTQLAE